MTEPSQVEPMETTGADSERVRAAVLGRFGGGEPLRRTEDMVGEWDVAFGRSDGAGLAFVYRLQDDGSSEVEVLEGAVGPTAGHWSLNPDGTFSLHTWCPPLPELGVPDWGMDETRFHLAGLADGRRVIWNADGSQVLLLSRRSR
jgi:hypothetical protein